MAFGIDDEQDPDPKKRYKFPYGDFKRVHRCAVLSAESRAGQYKHFDIERAAAHLHEMMDGKKHVLSRHANAGSLRQCPKAGTEGVSPKARGFCGKIRPKD